MRPHERLEVWQTAVDFVVTVYKATEAFPKEERFGLTSQIRGRPSQSGRTLRKVRDATRHANSLISYRTHRVRQANWRPNF